MAETGHAKNVENWQKMMAACTGFGGVYKPSNVNLEIGAMNALLTEVDTEMDGVQTSIVPWNRIQDYRSKGMSVPVDVAVDAAGRMTTDPAQVAALLPLGGSTYGFKGAALASMLEVLSAVLTGMAHCSRLLPMAGEDISTPRRLGHFFIVINPEMFVSRAVYDAGMASYLKDIRSRLAKPGTRVMAPGDREWACADRRGVEGIPMPAGLMTEFLQIAADLGVDDADLRNGDGAGP